MSVQISSATAAYSSAYVYRCVTLTGVFPVHTHVTQLEGDTVDLMDFKLIILILTLFSTKHNCIQM